MIPVLYSCVTGSYDKVERTILASNPEFKLNAPIRFVLFTDSVTNPTTTKPHNIEWELQSLRWSYGTDRRRMSRWHKVNSHLLFPDTKTIWADGSQVLIADPLPLLEFAKPIGTFRHPERTCIYQEVEACVRLRKDNPILMHNQVEHYQHDWKYPAYNGLVETACVVRDGSDDVANSTRFMDRDQSNSRLGNGR